MIELFNTDSAQAISEPFYITDQTTIMQVGLGADEEIQFELVLMRERPIEPESNCEDCGIGNACKEGYPLSEKVIMGRTKLNCFDCSGNVKPVRMTSDTAFIIIDAPQKAWVRALYTGAHLGSFVVWCDGTNTHNVTQQMRGCCIPDPVVGVNIGGSILE